MQAFPLTVELHLTELSLHISFAYLPSLGLVTAEADSPAGNELLATLFEADSGVDTPNEANKYIGEDIFVFDAASTARPYRSVLYTAKNGHPAQLPGSYASAESCAVMMQQCINDGVRRVVSCMTVGHSNFVSHATWMQGCTASTWLGMSSRALATVRRICRSIESPVDKECYHI